MITASFDDISLKKRGSKMWSILVHLHSSSFWLDMSTVCVVDLVVSVAKAALFEMRSGHVKSPGPCREFLLLGGDAVGVEGERIHAQA